MAGAARDHYDVFLSHSGPDKPAVEELARRLIRKGIEPFLDIWNLIPGDAWQEALEEALINSATCAVFVGSGGFSPWQHEELRAAIENRVSGSRGGYRIIPVLLLSFTHISILTEVLTVINLAAIFNNTVHFFELSNELNENTITF